MNYLLCLLILWQFAFSKRDGRIYPFIQMNYIFIYIYFIYIYIYLFIYSFGIRCFVLFFYGFLCQAFPSPNVYDPLPFLYMSHTSQKNIWPDTSYTFLFCTLTRAYTNGFFLGGGEWLASQTIFWFFFKNGGGDSPPTPVFIHERPWYTVKHVYDIWLLGCWINFGLITVFFKWERYNYTSHKLLAALIVSRLTVSWMGFAWNVTSLC